MIAGQPFRACGDFRESQTSVPRAVGTVGGALHLLRMRGRYASFLPAEFIARWFATVNPPREPRADLEHGADAMGAPVGRLIDRNRHLDALK